MRGQNENKKVEWGFIGIRLIKTAALQMIS
jgi:hypothetical protein